MDVDKYNSPLIFEEFKNSLEQCDFCAIDQEMSGIECKEYPPSWTMSLPDLYKGSREVVNRYIAFQFGIALFTLKNNETYEVKSFNFYIQKNSGDIIANSDALLFLSLHNMDFKRWFNSGMIYCNKNEENKINLKSVETPILEWEKTIAFYIINKIEDWYFNSNNSSSNNNNNNEKEIIKGIINEKIEKLILSKLKEKEIFVLLEYDKKKEISAFPIELIISKVSKDNFNKYLKNILYYEKNNLPIFLGFREFWKCITNSKKPIIGHNFWSDIMFMIQMHEEPIPLEYEEYKKKVHELFPIIYDTKTLSRFTFFNEKPFSSLHLEGLYKHCLKINEESKNNIIFNSPAGYHYYDPSCIGNLGKAHEAGYDAYMTGIVFAIIKKNYENQNNFNLSKYENIISVFGSHYFMNLNGKDILKFKSTFLLEFKEDVEYSFVFSLLSREKQFIEENNNNIKDSFLDFKLTYDNNKRRGKIFILQHLDETINEEIIQGRIELSLKEINLFLNSIMDKNSLTLPQIKKISRFMP